MAWKTISEEYVEQGQKKKDSIQSKMFQIYKLARFFPHSTGGDKVRQFQTWNYF